MLNPLQVLRVILGQKFAAQTLQRTPEQFDDSAVMDDADSVSQYDEAMQSKLVIVYAGALLHIHQTRRRTTGGRAVDLCCGPGHFTLLLAKYFDYDEVIGVDLSEPMIHAASENAKRWGLEDRVRFDVGDATAYAAADGSFDLVTCNDAAHHLPCLDLVKSLIVEMDRLSGGEGLAVLTDLVRLKTASLTDRYTTLIGQDYIDRGLIRFQEDFCNSMQAAWTGAELSSALPIASSKHWNHKVQKLLPTVQLITGYPDDGQPMALRTGEPWTQAEHPIAKDMQGDWKLFRLLL